MNPRVPLRALAAVAIWLLAFSLPAQAQPAPHSFFARGSLGTATMALTDWRNVIDAEKKAFEAAHVPAQWEDFATTFEPAFEVDYMMTRVLSIGAGFSYQQAASDNSYGDSNFLVARRIQVSIATVRGILTYWPRGGGGLFVGAEAGNGTGAVTDEFHVRFVTLANDLDITSKYDGSGVVGGVFAGYQHWFGPGTIGALRVRYQTGNLGVLSGHFSSPQLGSGSAKPTDASGKQINTDFGGLGLAVSIGTAFGGHR